MRRLIAMLVLVACTAAPAAEGAKPAVKPEPGTSVEMPFLIAPLSKDGKLLGYAYISSKLIASSQSAAIAVRQKLAFIQDANVRDVNAATVGKSDDPIAVDKDALSDRLAANAKRVMGESIIVDVVITAVQFAPLHPSDSTLNMLPSSEQAQAVGQAVAPNHAGPAAAGTPAAAPSANSAATSQPPPPSAH